MMVILFLQEYILVGVPLNVGSGGSVGINDLIWGICVNDDDFSLHHHLGH